MSPRARNLALTAHVTASVGWLGAVAVVLVLGVAGLASDDSEQLRSAYIALEPITWFGLVPFAFASLVTGVVQALGTPWGLFRHYWVVAKLVINLFATVVLLMYTQTVTRIADAAADPSSSTAELRELGLSPVLHAAAALGLLATATVFAIYKPRGLTPYGARRLNRRS